MRKIEQIEKDIKRIEDHLPLDRWCPNLSKEDRDKVSNWNRELEDERAPSG